MFRGMYGGIEVISLPLWIFAEGFTEGTTFSYSFLLYKNGDGYDVPAISRLRHGAPAGCPDSAAQGYTENCNRICSSYFPTM